MAICRGLCCLAGLVTAVAGLATYPLTASASSTADTITLAPAPQESIVFDRNDRPVFTFFRERRTDVPLDRVSPNMIAAVLAIEDRRFYSHHGVDFIRVLGAAWADVRARRYAEGARRVHGLPRRRSPPRTRAVSHRRSAAARDSGVSRLDHTRRSPVQPEQDTARALLFPKAT